MTRTDEATDGRHRSEEAPSAESDVKPDDPTDLDARSWKYVARKTLHEFTRDECTDLAAALTYYAVLALFPALIALMSLVGLLGQGQEAARTVLQILRDVGASGAADTLEPTLTELSRGSGAGLALVIGLLAALWSASGYVGAFGRAMNRVYEIGEGRPIWKLRPLLLGLTAVMVVLAAAVLVALVVTGPAAEAVGSALGVGSTAVTVWGVAKWPVILGVVVLVVALLYYVTPNVEQPKFRWISVGAVFAIVVWAILSGAFGLYVANFASYNKTYGALAGVIVFLLWLWLTNVALLFGAELDSELERGRQLQAGIPAEDELQLPLRDTTQLDKKAEKEADLLEEGTEIRTERVPSEQGTDREGDPS